ncbi:MAG: glycoside hydrolase family 2 TIM barrel-domain containing protein [Isosphaeraceae bacterium]
MKNAAKVHAWMLSPLLVSLALITPARAAETIDLSGSWRLRIDREDRGLRENWHAGPLAGDDTVQLPGMMQAQGKGDPVSEHTRWTGQIVDRSWFTAPEYARYRQPGNIKVPFWLQPDRHYVGPAWYQREIEIPESTSGHRLTLTLERPHIETRAWLDEKSLGTSNSLSTPHRYVLGTDVKPGKHRLTIRVDNRLVVDVGVNSHSVSDHTQGNWNGIAGRIVLEAGPPLWIEDLQVFPNPRTWSAVVTGRIGNATGKAGRGVLSLAAEFPPSDRRETLLPQQSLVEWTEQGGTFRDVIQFGFDAPRWDEFTPALYRVTATLNNDARTVRTVPFGLRAIDTAGTQFRINGRKVLFRGTLECAIFPRTGHPPTDLASWKRIVGIAKDHGLNMFRFHSWCPPEAAFQAADELGFYLQVECGSWANTSTSLGEGKPIDGWLYEEAERILAAYGNHPSFVLLAYGNEPAGKDREYLTKWVDHFKARDPRRLYAGGAGWPEIPADQYHISPGPRIQAWGDGLKSRINARPPETTTDYRDYVKARKVPVISHEVGQWCAYPNFAEMAAYTGPLKPRNFEIFRDSLEAHGMLGQAHDFLITSGKLQTLCYKEEIEALLRTPGLGGFQLLALYDFPGQGTALVGVLDALWNAKGYVTPAGFRRFCNSTVPLARLSRRVYTADEPFEAALELAHFGPRPLKDAVLAWSIVGPDGKAAVSGRKVATIPVDNGVSLGTITASLRDLPAPARCRLVLSVEGTPFENDWDFWVYPARPAIETAPEGVTVVSRLDEKAEAALQAGGRVLLLIPPGQAREDRLGKVALGFSSIFWNTAWTRRQPPHTLGILCDPSHPALAGFPTESHSNWQWWYLLNRADALILEDLPRELRPVVQVVDDWVTNRRLGLVIEAASAPASCSCAASTSIATWRRTPSPGSSAPACWRTSPATASTRRSS